MINSRSSRDPEFMHLLRCLSFLEVRHSFRLEVTHIPGKDNVLTDDLYVIMLLLSTQGINISVISLSDSTPTIRPPGGQRAELDFIQLDVAVHYYFKQGVAQLMLNTYSAAWKKFNSFLCYISCLVSSSYKNYGIYEYIMRSV